ncbi:MAG: hypothetical protein WCI04_06390 [archaeon]
MEQKTDPIKMGGIIATVSKGFFEPNFRYTFVYPQDQVAIRTNEKNYTFEELLRGSKIGTLVESRIFRHLKSIFPKVSKVKIFYTTSGALLTPRRAQLKKIRGVINPRAPGELLEDYKKIKDYLKAHRLIKLKVEGLKRSSQKNKKLRFSKGKSA